MGRLRALGFATRGVGECRPRTVRRADAGARPAGRQLRALRHRWVHGAHRRNTRCDASQGEPVAGARGPGRRGGDSCPYRRHGLGTRSGHSLVRETRDRPVARRASTPVLGQCSRVRRGGADRRAPVAVPPAGRLRHAVSVSWGAHPVDHLVQRAVLHRSSG